MLVVNYTEELRYTSDPMFFIFLFGCAVAKPMTKCYLQNLRVSTLDPVIMALQWLDIYSLFKVIILTISKWLSYLFVLQLAVSMEQGLPVLPEWLSFNRVNVRARKGVEIGPASLLLRYGA